MKVHTFITFIFVSRWFVVTAVLGGTVQSKQGEVRCKSS